MRKIEPGPFQPQILWLSPSGKPYMEEARLCEVTWDREGRSPAERAHLLEALRVQMNQDIDDVQTAYIDRYGAESDEATDFLADHLHMENCLKPNVWRPMENVWLLEHMDSKIDALDACHAALFPGSTPREEWQALKQSIKTNHRWKKGHTGLASYQILVFHSPDGPSTLLIVRDDLFGRSPHAHHRSFLHKDCFEDALLKEFRDHVVQLPVHVETMMVDGLWDEQKGVMRLFAPSRRDELFIDAREACWPRLSVKRTTPEDDIHVETYSIQGALDERLAKLNAQEMLQSWSGTSSPDTPGKKVRF